MPNPIRWLASLFAKRPKPPVRPPVVLPYARLGYVMVGYTR